MKFITQTIFGGEAGGRKGNCLQACVASIMDLELDDVPHFAELPENPGGWTADVISFAALVGWGCLVRSPAKPPTSDEAIAVGWSPRNKAWTHAVVVYRSVADYLEWDPHPDHTGLVRPFLFLDFWKL